MAVDKTIEDALKRESLELPPSPPVADIKAEHYVDADGNDALRVNVVLADDTTDEQLTGDNILQLKSAIRRQLVDKGVALFPYIFLATKAEFEERPEGEE